MSIRLIAYLSAAAIAAVVLAYGLGRWLIISGLLTAMSMLTGCQTPVPVQNCPRPPALSPVLSVMPSPTYRERLQKVWLSQPSATKSPSDIKQ